MTQTDKILNLSTPRLLIVSQYFAPDINATSQIVTSLAAEISQHVKTTIVTNSISGNHQTDNIIRLRKVHQKTGSSTLSKILEATLFVLKATTYLLRNSKEREDHVLLFSNPPFALIVGAINRFVRGVSFSFVLQDIFPETAFQAGLLPPYGPIALILKTCFRTLLPKCQNVFVLSIDMQLKLLKLYPHLDNVSVIQNWAVQTFNTTTPAITPRLLRKEWGIPDDHLVIQYSGNLGTMHDIITILESARLLVNERITFLFIGKGAKLHQVLTYKERFQLQNINVQPLQPYDLLQTSLLTSDLSVVSLASGADNLVAPSKLYGILKSSRPVLFIGSSTNEIKRLIDEEEMGLHVCPGDSVRLAHILSNLNHKRQHLNKLGSNATIHYQLNYSVEKSADLYFHQIFKTMTSKRQR